MGYSLDVARTCWPLDNQRFRDRNIFVYSADLKFKIFKIKKKCSSLKDTPGFHGNDKGKTVFGEYACPYEKDDWEVRHFVNNMSNLIVNEKN